MNTTFDGFGISAKFVCEFCGKPLKRKIISVGGRSFSVPCFSSCGCAESKRFYDSIGKTRLACCIGKTLLERGKSIFFLPASGLVDTKINDLGEYARAVGVDVLILDDLGKESGGDYAASAFFNLIDSRYREERPLVLTSNWAITPPCSLLWAKRRRGRLVRGFGANATA